MRSTCTHYTARVYMAAIGRCILLLASMCDSIGGSTMHRILFKGSFTGKVAFSGKWTLHRMCPVYSVFTYIGVGILYPTIDVVHSHLD